MKKIALLITMLLCAIAIPAAAQEATSILDQSAAALKQAGNAKIDFSYVSGGSAANGSIKLQGSKFVLNMGGLVTWFDGKTMWQYNKKNEEVSVTEPSAADLAKINPYSFLSFYKKGYKASMGKSTASDYQVTLAGSGAGRYKKVVLAVSKKTSYPSSITLTTESGHTVSIVCKSVHKNQKFSASTFRYDKKKFPKAEIVDLR